MPDSTLGAVFPNPGDNPVRELAKQRLAAFDGIRGKLLEVYDSLSSRDRKIPFPDNVGLVTAMASAGQVSGSLAINNRCNFSCEYCYILEPDKDGRKSWYRTKKPGSFTLDRALAVAKEGLKVWGLITIPAMEPLLTPTSREIVADLANINSAYAVPRRAGIISNLSQAPLLNEAQLAAIQNGITDFSFSLDSHSKEINDLGRGAGSYEKTIKGLEFLLKKGISPDKFTVQAVVYNGLAMPIKEQVRGLIGLANNYGITRISFSACISQKPNRMKDLGGYKDLYWKFIRGTELADSSALPGTKVVAYTTYENALSLIGLSRVARHLIGHEELELNPYELSLFAELPNTSRIKTIVEFGPVNMEAGCYGRFTTSVDAPLVRFRDGVEIDLGTSISECFDYQRGSESGEPVGSWIPGLTSHMNERLMNHTEQVVARAKSNPPLARNFSEMTSLEYMDAVTENSVRRMLDRNSELKSSVYDKID